VSDNMRGDNAETLKVAEHFFSIQGEGRTVGIASVFLRLSGCVLNCKWCDTVEVWKQGSSMSFKELSDLFDLEGYSSRLANGAHLVLTGGDPLIQQKQLLAWLRSYQKFPFYIELETEGVLQPDRELENFVAHYNVSPKLFNSGMSAAKRLRPNVLKYHSMRQQDIFKFPIANEADALEALDICDSVSMPGHRVYFMPICSTRKEHDEVGPIVVELAKKHRVNYSPRLHLQLWDLTTGV
jgi:7-carboxy-7-deazaguanine synthase